MSAAPTLTRRALARLFASGTAALGLAPLAAGAAPAPATAPAPAADPALRDAALRGLALAGHRGDPVSARAAQDAIARLASTDPEGALLARLYRALDVRPAGDYWRDHAAALPETLSLLHDAIARSRPVTFDYIDQSDQHSQRMVLPLALVHPPQGVKLMAWCELRQAYRQFFVREMTGTAAAAGDFSAMRLSLLQGLVEKERA